MKSPINLIIAAMDSEVNALLEQVNNYKEVDIIGYKSYKFQINDQEYLLFKGKVGKANTAYFLGQLFLSLNVKRVFNIGTSGGTSKDLNINDVIIADKVAYHDVDVTLFDYKLGQIPQEELYYLPDSEFIKNHPVSSKFSIKHGLILSGDIFVNKNNFSKTNISKFDNCLCCEMESATVGQICTKNKIPFVIIRSISDSALEDFDMENNDKNVYSSSTSSALVLLDMIKNY